MKRADKKAAGARRGWVESRDQDEPLAAEPWMPPPYDDRDIAAMQALSRGTASGEQQQRALAWILYASGVNQWGYVPNDPSARDVWHGRTFLGHQIRKLITRKLKTPGDREHDR